MLDVVDVTIDTIISHVSHEWWDGCSNFILKCPRSKMSCHTGANLFGQPLWSRCDILVGLVVICLANGTPWKIHMEPTNHLIEEETHLPIFHFGVPC